MTEKVPTARIALISATASAIPPAEEALAREYPTAETWNLVDDRLLTDANDRGGVDAELRERMERLIAYAADSGASGILLTCSMYGSIATATRLPIPVLAPDEAAIDELLAAKYRKVLVVASLETALTDSVSRLRSAFESAGVATVVTGTFAPDAMAATRSGDLIALAESLVDAARESLDDADAVFLAQYTLAPAGPALARAFGLPVISGPASSAIRLRHSITSQG